MSIVQRARPEIQALTAYEAAEQVEDSVRLNANESPHSSGIGNFRRPLNRYPEVRPKQLRKALAERFACTADQLLVTRGSSEAIDLIVRAFCRAGTDNIVIPVPTFSMYSHYAEVQGAAVIEVATLAEQNFQIDVDALLAACNDETRIVFVCSPNNPTGSLIPRADLKKLIATCDERAVVVVDEAYIEFSNEQSAIELLERYPNLLVLRTLSKALGFAGARCGAVIGSSEVLQLLSAIQAPYALATPVVECVEDVLAFEQLEYAEGKLSEIIAERKRVSARVADYAFVTQLWPSDANFFLIRVTQPDVVMKCCTSRNILLRRLSGDFSDCIRISIGSKADNNRLLVAFDTVAESHNA